VTTWLEEACIAEEAARDSRMATNMTQPLMHTLAQAAEIIGRGIGQDGVVQMIPERLNGIEFGRIGWEPFGVEPGAAGLDGLLHQAATMGGQTIPQQDDGFTPMAGQRPKKLYQMGRSDAAGMYGQQPAQAAAVGAGKHCGDPGQPLPIEGLTDHWCTAPWRPRGPNGRALRKARFVQENQPGVQARGLFLLGASEIAPNGQSLFRPVPWPGGLDAADSTLTGPESARLGLGNGAPGRSSRSPRPRAAKSTTLLPNPNPWPPSAVPQPLAVGRWHPAAVCVQRAQPPAIPAAPGCAKRHTSDWRLGD